MALPDLLISAEVATARDAISALRAHRPDSLFFVRPERFPDRGLDLSRRVRRKFPAVRLLVIVERAEIDLFFAYADLGIVAYFLDGNPDHVIEDLRRVQAGEVVLDRRLVDEFARFLQKPLGQAALHAAEAMGSRGGSTAPANGKELRRHTVVRLVEQGLTNEQIGQALQIAKSTVDEHLKRHRAEVGHVPRAALGRTLANRNGS